MPDSSFRMPPKVEKNGFCFGYNRFSVVPSGISFIDGPTLRSMFLPKTSREGEMRISLYKKDTFVRDILKHYDVKFSESEISGTGVDLLRKCLLAGKCDTVPDHIAELRDELYEQWLKECTLKELSSYPQAVLDKCFLTKGKPDRTKSTAPLVAVPMHKYGWHDAKAICELAADVAGLHARSAKGPETQTVYLGWDQAAVDAAADGHAAKETEKLAAEERAREEERDRQHNAYLTELAAKKPKEYSIVGKYVVRCKEIEYQWPEDGKHLTMSIRTTRDPKVYQADFHFGVIEGNMVITKGKPPRQKGDKETASAAAPAEGEPNGASAAGTKRKSAGDDGPPAKKPKPLPSFVLRVTWCYETGEGQTQPDFGERGDFQFTDERLVAFAGKTDLPCVGADQPFSGRKISDDPGPASSFNY